MRLARLLTAFAAAVAVPLAAQTVTEPPVEEILLRPGEVLLEINAAASITTRADLATVQAEIGGDGASAGAARADAEANGRRLLGAARAAGVAPGDIEAQPILISELPPGMDSGNRYYANGRILLRVRDVSRLEAIEAVAGDGGPSLADISYSLADPEPALAEARRRALADARADAEIYAAASNMRIARMVRVTTRLGSDALGVAMSERGFGLEGRADDGRPEIVTSVIVGVDFALVPR